MTCHDNVPSPCVGVCRIDEARGRCEGCLRTLEEIGRWSALGTGDKRALLAELPGRRQRASEGRSEGGGIE